MSNILKLDLLARDPAPYVPADAPAEIISLDARRVSRALQHAAELEDVAIDYGRGQF